MLQCIKYVVKRQGALLKSLIVTLKLPKAVGSEKYLATQMSSKALLKLTSSNDSSI